jgi:spore coat polysaccharide biosynthesis protein SpsF (cytidylyltransferase family)
LKIGIALLCRLSSTRLPGKHLRIINGRKVLDYIMDRVRLGACDCPVFVATSDDPSDDRLARYCQKMDYPCFRGSLEDVSGRFLACAEKFGWNFIVRINGDNLFADPSTIQSMLAIAETSAYDFITNKPGQTFPLGCGVEIVRTSFYRETMAHVQNSYHREHVTTWLYENIDVGRRYVYQNKQHPEWAGVRLVLDTHDDLVQFDNIISRMERPPHTYDLKELVCLARQDQTQDESL